MKVLLDAKSCIPSFFTKQQEACEKAKNEAKTSAKVAIYFFIA
jgi:hypothetical protein